MWRLEDSLDCRSLLSTSLLSTTALSRLASKLPRTHQSPPLTTEALGQQALASLEAFTCDLETRIQVLMLVYRHFIH